MFSTALCPLASELLLRYPGSGEPHGVTITGAALMLAVGMTIGFLTPAMAAHSPNVHKGYEDAPTSAIFRNAPDTLPTAK